MIIVRTKLSEDMFGNKEWVDPPAVGREVITFYGEQCGLRILKVDGCDDLQFELLSTDDGHWFPKTGHTSVGWLADLERVVYVARKWWGMSETVEH